MQRIKTWIKNKVPNYNWNLSLFLLISLGLKNNSKSHLQLFLLLLRIRLHSNTTGFLVLLALLCFIFFLFVFQRFKFLFTSLWEIFGHYNMPECMWVIQINTFFFLQYRLYLKRYEKNEILHRKISFIKTLLLWCNSKWIYIKIFSEMGYILSSQ